jgi:hypothetical protein
MQDDAMKEMDQERAEFEALVAAFSGTPRSLRLLQYIGENYFAGQLAELCEFSIATEVFGRPKSRFNPAEDAIARAETHRLRKRLKDYYGGDGRNHTLHFSLPPATYVPVFIYADDTPARLEDTADTETEDSPNHKIPVEVPRADEEEQAHRSIARVIPIFRERRQMLIAMGIAAIVVGFTIFAVVRWIGRHREGSRIEPAQVVSATAVPAPAVPASESVRLLAGYFGSPQIDGSGNMWKADQYFQGGGTRQVPPAQIFKTTSRFIFGHWREGNFSYAIPLKPGVYELHLYFVTADTTDTLRTFNVIVNGKTLLSGLDVDSDAFGPNIADEKIFRDISPAPDGMLHVYLGNAEGTPQLNAIEVLPGTPRRQLPIRLITRSTPYIDHLGQLWRPDNYFMEGHIQTDLRPISGTPDPDVFASERFGRFTYTIPVDTRDQYTVVLHFTEHYFGSQGPASNGVGSRVFRVLCNGETLLDNFDIYKEAGSLHALTKTFHHLRPSAQGKLELTFEPITNYATVSGIEVLDESP